MKAYGVVYASQFDEKNVFLREEDAKQYMELVANRLDLRKDDPMIRIVEFVIHEKYDPSLYAPKKITLKKEEMKND